MQARERVMKRICAAVVLLLSIMSLPAIGALNLELTQGVSKAEPIAVPDFLGPQVLVPGNKTMTAVIDSDLGNSGQFRLLGSDNPNMNITQPIDYNYWRQQGVNDALLGQISKSMTGDYTVRVQLLDVYTKALLLNTTYTVPLSQLRQLAHKISDAVYQKLTGVRGIFSTKLAYVLVQRAPGKQTRYLLEVCDADGFNPHALLASPMPIMSPAWTPNGKRLAYVSFEHARAVIYMQNIQTGARVKVSDAPGINGAPAFSPNGKNMALVLTKTGYPKIYLMNLATHQQKELTHGRAIDTEPNFAPDGKSMLFTSSRGGSPQIYRYTFATGNVNRVTYDGNYNARARFFPNGQNVIMLHRDSGIFGIAKQNLDNGQVQVLTRANADESPSLAPNGRMVIYATEYGGRGVLAMVSTDGRVKLRLPARKGSVQEPAWSPYL
jgi:TolB protein